MQAVATWASKQAFVQVAISALALRPQDFRGDALTGLDRMPERGIHAACDDCHWVYQALAWSNDLSTGTSVGYLWESFRALIYIVQLAVFSVLKVAVASCLVPARPELSWFYSETTSNSPKSSADLHQHLS